MERFKTRWRASCRNVVRFWHDLNDAAIVAVRHPGRATEVGPVTFKRDGDFLFLRLPSSRRIAFPFPRLIKTDRGDVAVSYMDASEGQWRACRHGHGAYGGIFFENAVQAIARDLLAGALWRLEDEGFPIVLHCHDEAVAEMPNGRRTPRDFSEIMTTLPHWAAGLPIAAEAWEHARYVK